MPSTTTPSATTPCPTSAPSPTSSPSAAPGHPRRWPALAVLCVSLVLTTIDNTVLNTALPTLARSLRASTADLQWISDSYTLAFAALLVVAGGLGVRYGQRLALVCGLATFALGSAAAATASGSTELIAWRALMGMGAAFVMPATMATLISLFPARERARALAVWSSTAGLGVVIGPILGGALLDHFAWGSVFWINVPLVAAALVAVLLVVPPVPGRRGRRFDLPGVVLSAAGLTALVDAVIQAPSRGWTDAVTAGELAASVVLLILFVVRELHTAEPMIDVRVFTHRAFSAATLSIGVTFFALFGTLFLFSQYLQLVHGFRPLTAGLGALPFALAMACTAATSNLTAARLGNRATIGYGLAVMSVGLGWLSTTGVRTPFALLSLAMSTIGAGMGLVMAPASESTVAALPPATAATAATVNSIVRELGGVLGIAVVGSLASASYRNGMTGLPSGTGAAGQDLATAHRLAAHLSPSSAQHLITAADRAFTTAMDRSALVCAAVTLAGALMAATVLPPRRR